MNVKKEGLLMTIFVAMLATHVCAASPRHVVVGIDRDQRGPVTKYGFVLDAVSGEVHVLQTVEGSGSRKPLLLTRVDRADASPLAVTPGIPRFSLKMMSINEGGGPTGQGTNDYGVLLDEITGRAWVLQGIQDGNGIPMTVLTEIGHNDAAAVSRSLGGR